MTEKKPLILINDVDYAYPNGTVALKGINLTIYEGELVGIMGKNGAGKTTLIRTLNGLVRPSHGNIFIDGENINSKSVANLSKRVGIMFQNPMHQLFSNTVEEEIKFSLKSFDLDKEEIQIRIDNLLKQFKLEKYKDKSPLNLSGGEKKKLAIASIICRDPDVLVFDEPTLGQDAREIRFFRKLIDDASKKEKTIVIGTHNIEFAIEYIPRIVLMADGQIMADGPTEKILTNRFLVEKTSLILPQVSQFLAALKENGIQCPDEINSRAAMVKFLIKFLKNKSTKILEEFN